MDEEPHTDSVLTDEQIAAIKKSATINTLDGMYIMAAQADTDRARADMTDRQREIERIDNNKIGLTVLCPFCNAAWTAAMLDDLYSTGGGCHTCSYGSAVEGTLDIFCTNCHRLIYRKEYDVD